MVSDPLASTDTPPPDEASMSEVASRAERVLRPLGALRRLDELAVWLAGWQRTASPAVRNPVVLIFAGDHGVVVEGVSAYPASVTGEMVEALRNGVATASVMARGVGAELRVVDVGVGRPTGNIRFAPALGDHDFSAAVARGRHSVASIQPPPDLLVLGEVGIGNTTSAAAISMALFGGAAGDWAGRGSGVDDRALGVKRAVVADAVARARALSVSPIELFAQLGGWESAAIAGATIEARQRSIPVLLDGFVVTSAVMPLEVERHGYLDHCWPAHVSAEPGHRSLVERLGRPPILDLEMRLGEGSGAITAIPIVALAAQSVTGVATFEEWGLP